MIASRVVNCFDGFKKELSYLAVLLFVLLSVIRYLYVSGGIYFDSVEHIYASWLISDGKQPYKDFFEHHNPLLWYLFAPVTKFFYRDIMIFYVARAMALAGNFACMYMVYKIVLSIYDKRSAVFAILMLFIFPMWGDILTFRPDVFMSLFFLLSVFWNIKYLDYAKRRYLLLSYCSLVISFAFLQKVAFLGIGFVLANCCLVIKNKIKIKDFFIAGFSALALLLLMISFLWYEGILAEWWHYNFIYNMQLKTYYRTYESGMPHFLKFFTLLVGLAVIRFYRISDKILLILLPWCMMTISLLMFFPHTQYVYNFIYLSAIILGGAFAKRLRVCYHKQMKGWC